MAFKSHPFHPAIVHFPIAFLTFAHGVDIFHYLTQILEVPFITSLSAPLFPAILSTSRIIHTLGLITALPAIASGVQQAGVQASKPGALYEADGKTITKKFYVMATHAAINDLVIIISAVNWYGRYKQVGIAGESVPSGLDYVTAGLIIPVLFFTASLGADLVYKHGMGFSASKSGKKE
ncbi:hypothetical protein ABW19_dt0209840 [Dactylella cylindrospora]|nr:hypothetical protein ABW19_dt0209840 [Dactylella cylindrospora]